IPAGGFLLVWADGDTNQNHLGGELHAGFDLAASGEAIGLYTPDLVELDHVTFGPQVTDQSQGRYPDGGSSITNMVAPSPRLSNPPPYNNTPPALDFIPNQIIPSDQTLSFTVVAHDTDLPVQTLAFTLDPGAPSGASIDPSTGLFAWTPSVQATTTNTITIR